MEILYIPQTAKAAYQVITINDRENRSIKCSPCSSCNTCLGKRAYYQWRHKKYCCQCFEKLYGQRCGLCRELITGSNKINFIYFNNQAWHLECFKCPSCGVPITQTCFHQCLNVVCTNCKNHIKLS